jgi:hypothetical protein
LGNASLLDGRLDSVHLRAFEGEVQSRLEAVVDAAKTSPEDVDVVLVGGGAIFAPETLRGARRVVRPRHAGVANAIGAGLYLPSVRLGCCSLMHK